MKKKYIIIGVITILALAAAFWKMTRLNHFYQFSLATFSDNLPAMEQMVKAGYNINDKAKGLRHLQLYLAGRQNHIYLPTIEKMFELGYKFNLDTDKSMPELHYCVMGGDLEAIKLLLAHGADVNLKNKIGATALDIALFLKKYEIANYLLKHTPAKINLSKRNDIATQSAQAVHDGKLSSLYFERIKE